MYNEFKNVIEFRDANWWTSVVRNRLKREGLTFCGIDYPGLPNDAVITNKTVYYRFHVRPRLYHSAYKRPDLAKVADVIHASKKAAHVYIYFNNTATEAAIKNAGRIKQYISDPT